MKRSLTLWGQQEVHKKRLDYDSKCNHRCVSELQYIVHLCGWNRSRGRQKPLCEAKKANNLEAALVCDGWPVIELKVVFLFVSPRC